MTNMVVLLGKPCRHIREGYRREIWSLHEWGACKVRRRRTDLLRDGYETSSRTFSSRHPDPSYKSRSHRLDIEWFTFPSSLFPAGDEALTSCHMKNSHWCRMMQMFILYFRFSVQLFSARSGRLILQKINHSSSIISAQRQTWSFMREEEESFSLFTFYIWCKVFFMCLVVKPGHSRSRSARGSLVQGVDVLLYWSPHPDLIDDVRRFFRGETRDEEHH